MTKYDREAEQIATQAGKTVKETIIVTAKAGNDDFAINNAIKDKVAEMGYDIGTMQRDDPRGLAKNTDIEKWRNIPMSQYPRLEGVVLCDDNRNGGEGAIILFG